MLLSRIALPVLRIPFPALHRLRQPLSLACRGRPLAPAYCAHCITHGVDERARETRPLARVYSRALFTGCPGRLGGRTRVSSSGGGIGCWVAVCGVASFVNSALPSTYTDTDTDIDTDNPTHRQRDSNRHRQQRLRANLLLALCCRGICSALLPPARTKGWGGKREVMPHGTKRNEMDIHTR